ncbi:MAG TPA: ATPase, T2SS/T4P/T4SS family [Syntrophales bacterium]|nr:ATPase, T2SS/T4P/T4SS family [Syntrophales bacterium]HPI57949.1 ATPase, T2SS/T4P/T4SS family [Syntrophales bacterium]HPN24572.1 ATPase, T2SS/T4P/T4SS family [Syntrophales bacterium]HQM28878.1 ATPase, T2SS/T4P/T4SS family [Syntrophales bacterium]
MKKSKYKISLYVLIPLIFTGISLIAVIMTYQIFRLLTNPDEYVRVWGIAIALFAFAIALVITWLVMRPIRGFIKRVIELPVFAKTPARNTLTPQGDDIKEYKVVFEKVTDLLSKVEPREIYPDVIGQSKAVRLICDQIAKVRPADAAVLIQGEEGTGKELVARVIHKSTAGNRPFIAINCSSQSEMSLELDLFGYEKGTFTGAKSRKYGQFEAADDGTLFLDDIGGISLNMQSRLLRVLQEREFERTGGREKIKLRPRVIAASNGNLPALVKEGKFRDDLYYFLNVVSIDIPPLRERKEDIPLLVDYLLKKIAHDLQKDVVAVSTDVMDAFLKYAWPGNVTEMENLLSRAAAVAKGETLQLEDFPHFVKAIGEPAVLDKTPDAEGRVPAAEMDLGRLLVTANLLNEAQLQTALAERSKTGQELKDMLIQRGWVSEDGIVDLFSLKFNLDKYSPDRHPLDIGFAHLVPVKMARKYRAAPLGMEGRVLKIAVTDPTDTAALETLKLAIEGETQWVVCTENEMDLLLNSLYNSPVISPETRQAFAAVNVSEGAAEKEITLSERGDRKIAARQEWAEDKMVVRLVSSIIARAIQEGASEVLFNPQASNLQVRLRIGGKLSEVTDLPKSTFLPIVSRIRKLAEMEMAAANVAEDGRFTVKMEDREYGIRVSSIPAVHGENIILNLQDVSDDMYDLSRLGMSRAERDKLESVLHRPNGLILCCGPAVSGKTTTLYAMLKEIRRPDTHIMTVEDPVEYYFEGISQIQLNRRAGMSFSDGMRSVMRHAPDVIMVGELREAETAAMAMQASLSCRVFSALQDHNAAGAITRLLNLGVERFLVASVLLASVSQRLVRTICPQCRESYRPAAQVLDLWGLTDREGLTFSYGKGCEACNHTGYKGRIGIFEVLVIDEMIREMIIKGWSEQEILQAAVKSEKLKTLKEDAIQKVQTGITTLEEATSAIMI